MADALPTDTQSYMEYIFNIEDSIVFPTSMPLQCHRRQPCVHQLAQPERCHVCMDEKHTMIEELCGHRMCSDCRNTLLFHSHLEHVCSLCRRPLNYSLGEQLRVLMYRFMSLSSDENTLLLEMTAVQARLTFLNGFYQNILMRKQLCVTEYNHVIQLQQEAEREVLKTHKELK